MSCQDLILGKNGTCSDTKMLLKIDGHMMCQIEARLSLMVCKKGILVLKVREILVLFSVRCSFIKPDEVGVAYLVFLGSYKV